MSEMIKHGFISVKDLFTNQWYKIPEFQRPYVWGKEQVDELLVDIMNESVKFHEAQRIDQLATREYFLGSLVWKTSTCNDGITNYEEFEVLDGQQRLTTMLLIHAVIRDLTDNDLRRTTCANAVFQEANPDDGIPERLRIVFGIRGDVQKFIDTYVKAYKGTLLHDELLNIQLKSKDGNCVHMAETILAIHDFFAENTQDSIESFFSFFRQYTKVIFISSSDLEDAFHLFNVMNNRGIKLRNSDILKAKNLSFIKDEKQRLVYAEQWEQIENFFGEDFDQFLEFIRLCIVKKKAAVSLLKEFEDNIYHPTEFDRTQRTKQKLTPLLTEGAATFDCLTQYFKAYQDIFDNTSYSVRISNLLKAMEYGVEAQFWKAPVLHYRIKFGATSFDGFLEALNKKFVADWVSELYLTKRIENTCKIIEAIDSAVTAEGVLCSDAFSYDKELTLAHLDSKLYGKKYCRYLLLLINVIKGGDEAKLNMPEIVSIEHILPQNPASDSQWVQDFDTNQREECTNKLGNLMLISRKKNSTLSNHDFNVKREKYFKEHVSSFPLSSYIYGNYQTWTYNDYSKNHAEMIKELKDFFDITDADITNTH